MDLTKTVICVLGSDLDSPALDFAADECLRTGSPLHLMHAVPHDLAQLIIGREADEQIEGSVLWSCAREVRSRLPSTIVVTSELVSGSVAEVLRHRVLDARLVIVQAAHRRWPHRTWVDPVTWQSLTPVITVPSLEARPGVRRVEAGRSSAGRVVVGVDVPAKADHLIEAGLREATLRRAALVVLHSWTYRNVPDSEVIDGYERETWTECLHAAVCDVMERSANSLPPDRITVTVIHSGAAQALVEESRYADLIVVGHDLTVHRRTHGSPWGPIAQHLIQHSACPVMVVGSDSSTREACGDG